jgi:thiol-disulfide isomerase/thioredoxin
VFQRVVQVPAPAAGPGDDPFDVGEAVLTPRSDRGLDIGAAVPAIAVTTLDGKPLNLADYRGKYVLLAFWASWCAPCRAETPHLKAAYEAFGKDERLALVGLSLDDTPDEAQKYVAENRLAWTQGFVGRAPSERVTADLGVAGIPSIWLVGPDGKVVAKGLRGGRIQQALATALGKPQ